MSLFPDMKPAVLAGQQPAAVPVKWRKYWPNEEWRPVTIAGYEQNYHVSCFGRVRRMKPGSRTWTFKMLKPKAPPSRLHYRVKLCRKGEGKVEEKTVEIRVLVALAFLQPPEEFVGWEGRWVVKNIDGQPHNDRADNLRWERKGKEPTHV